LALGSTLTQAVLEDLDAAPIEPRLRETIRFLRQLTREPDLIDARAVERVAATGVSRLALEDALLVAFCFNLITRLADALDWHIPDQSGFETSGRSLLERGYLMPLRTRPIEGLR
jgi:hypothetical protein